MTNNNRPSVGELLELLTGYDERKIVARFGHPPLTSDDEPGLVGSMQLRALAFSHKMHTGLDDQAAFDAAMNMSLRDLNDYFADDAADAETNEPVTEQGKGD